ncbi:MAG: tetratricopeptide repeat protein [Bacteroidetes bacterium]|nr:tetratricopeptide repeat protein [Bacteroidota bacterium]
MNKLKYIFFFLIFLLPIICNSQQKLIDSLGKVIAKSKEDTLRVNSINALSKAYFSTKPSESVRYGNEAKNLSEKLKYKRGLALSYKNIGIGYYQQGIYTSAISNWDQAMAVWDSLGDKVGVSNMLNNEGSVYFNQGDDAKALELYLKSLKIAEDIHDTLRVVTALYNIGAVYSNKTATFNKAKEYYLRALPLAIKIKDDYSIGTVTVNLGDIYFKEKDYTTALNYFEESLKAYEGSENIPYSLNCIGQVYEKRKDFQKAIIKHQQAYEISKKLDAKLDMTISLLGLASTYQQKGDLKIAESYYLQAKEIAYNLHAFSELKQVYEGLAKNFASLKEFANAYTYQQLLLDIKDTLYNIDTDKKLQGLSFAFDLEKKQNQINLLTKDFEIQQQITEKQKLIRNGFMGGFAIVLLFAGVFLAQRNRISKEKKRSDELLLNILPEEVAEELKAKGSADAKLIDEVTVLFTDFKGFTAYSEKMTPKELVKDIHECFSAFDRIMEKYRMEKIKTIGDSYMAAGGIPTPNNTHPEDAVNAAIEVSQFIEEGKARKIAMGLPYFEIRIGINTGPVVAGIVGVKKFAYDIWGDTVNTASRMESSGEAGRVNISGSTYEKVKDKFNCTHRGKVMAKGKGEIDMYFVDEMIKK